MCSPRRGAGPLGRQGVSLIMKGAPGVFGFADDGMVDVGEITTGLILLAGEDLCGAVDYAVDVAPAPVCLSHQVELSPVSHA